MNEQTLLSLHANARSFTAHFKNAKIKQMAHPLGFIWQVCVIFITDF
jgi:hypothetical protein